MEREYFKILLNLMMVSDPWPLSKKEWDDMHYFLKQTSRDFGYKDWVDAYHKM